MKARVRPLVLSLIVAMALGTTTGCIRLPSPLGPEGAGAPLTAPADPSSPAPLPDASASPDAGDEWGDAFAERDRFFEEQQLPLDGTPLVAVTPEQKEFIAQQKAYVEEQGATWTAQEESLSLALAADACETAILNAHAIDADLLRTHVATSPLFAQLVPADLQGGDRTSAEAPIASVMVFGTTFLCPDDGDAWIEAYIEVYGG
ncbi:hypothetical protein [Microbacterium sp.]|jgi:hypothetical protein|uniref:hypothetical protein n=1 Tax=Microbacterium sp. TaxID=51671 RepID=UPI0025F27526|nr:hypothetical protein [Microbacterium sp.]MBT9607062.1 hypothetical protein [Microbacterium sp.]